MIKTYKLFLPLSLLFTPVIGYGQNFIHCDYASVFDVTGCSLEPGNILSQAEFESDAFLTIRFSCLGHEAGIGLSSDVENFVPITADSKPHTYKITYASKIHFKALDAHRLHSLSFDPGCQLTIEKVLSLQPSQHTLTLWQEEATGLTQVLKSRFTAYQLIKATNATSDWDQGELLDLKEDITHRMDSILAPLDLETEDLFYLPDDPVQPGAVKDVKDRPLAYQKWVEQELVSMAQNRHAASPLLEFVSYLTLYMRVDAILTGRPPSASPSDIEVLRQSLENDLVRATSLIERSQKYQDYLNDSLKRTCGELEQLLSTLR